jgi:hypothetical protein
MTGACADVLARLEAVLRSEQAAVAGLDFSALEAARVEKLELTARLTAAGEELGGDADDATLLAATQRVRALAEANRALLVSTVETLAELISPRIDAGTYDARARVRPQMLGIGSKRA